MVSVGLLAVLTLDDSTVTSVAPLSVPILDDSTVASVGLLTIPTLDDSTVASVSPLSVPTLNDSGGLSRDHYWRGGIQEIHDFQGFWSIYGVFDISS